MKSSTARRSLRSKVIRERRTSEPGAANASSRSLGACISIEGFTPRDVTYFIRLAAAAGAKFVVLTNAAGGLNESFARGDVMLIADHLNLTGRTPLDGRRPSPFVNMIDPYSPRLRAAAHAPAGEPALREGIYAGVAGPAFETLAEARALRTLGADAVGMSTVLEAIAARALGLEVLGISLISNVIGPNTDVLHSSVLAASEEAAERIACVIDRVVAASHAPAAPVESP